MAKPLVGVARLGEDRVREVVVLIDADVELVTGPLEVGRQNVHLRMACRGGQHRLGHALRHDVSMVTGELVEPHTTVLVEARLHAVMLLLDAGEVEVDEKVLAVLGRRVAADVQPAEELVELRGVVDVVVRLQDGAPERLAEPPRTEKHRVAGLLQLADEPRAVYEIGVLPAHPRKVGNAVHDLLQAVHTAYYSKITAWREPPCAYS